MYGLPVNLIVWFSTEHTSIVCKLYLLNLLITNRAGYETRANGTAFVVFCARHTVQYIVYRCIRSILCQPRFFKRIFLATVQWGSQVSGCLPIFWGQCAGFPGVWVFAQFCCQQWQLAIWCQTWRTSITTTMPNILEVILVWSNKTVGNSLDIPLNFRSVIYHWL